MKILKKTYIEPCVRVFPMGPEMPVAYTRVKIETDDPSDPGPGWGGGSDDDDWGSVKGEVNLWDDEW